MTHSRHLSDNPELSRAPRRLGPNRAEIAEAVAEYLARGGAIRRIAPGGELSPFLRANALPSTRAAERSAGHVRAALYMDWN